MKKIFIIPVILLTSVAFANGEKIATLSAGLVAPVFSSTTTVPWTPAKGEIIFDGGTSEFKGYDGTQWSPIAEGVQPPVAKVMASPSTSITGSFTAFDFSSGDILFDSESALDVTNNKYVVPQDGIYQVMAYLKTDSSAEERAVVLGYKVNSGGMVELDIESRAIVAATYMGLSGSTLVELNEGDDLYFGATKNTGSPTAYAISFSIVRVRDKVN